MTCIALWPFCGARAAELVDIDTADGHETITISLKDINPHKVFTIEDPDRLVVDVPAVDGHPNPSLPDSYDGTLIKKMRFGQFDSDTSRFVFELEFLRHI